MNSFLKATAILAVAGFTLQAQVSQAQAVAHHNVVELKWEGPNKLSFAFALNLPQVLHLLLAPQLPYPAFLQSYADLPDPALERAVIQAVASLSAKAYITLPSGVKANLKQWQLPDKQVLRESFKIDLLLLKMPPGAPAHQDPVRVLAQVQTPTPLSRMQLQLPPALHPILVTLSNDKFWLTDQIPMAIVELP